MKSRNLSFALTINILLVITSCKKTIDVNTFCVSIFKPLESTRFYMVCDSLNDTIQYDTQLFEYNYEQPLYSSTEIQSINMDATINGSMNSLKLLRFQLVPEGDNNFLLLINFHFGIVNGDLVCQNNTLCFTDNFINEFELNGIDYKNCWFYNYPSLSGDLTTYLIYSPTFGVLRLTDYSSGAVYRRCFECE